MLNFIDTKDITDIEELEQVLLKNEKNAHNMRREIKKLNEFKLLFNGEITELVGPVIEFQKNQEQEEINNNEYLYYYEDIKNLDIRISDQELKQVIKDSLPSKVNVNYFKIVSRIKAEIYREIMTFDELSKEADDLEILNEIKLYVHFYQKKLDFINEVEKEKEIYGEPEIENNIVFLETKSGNIYAFSDLESINAEYYESFKELYDSIKNGTFKNVKRFTSANQKSKTLCEVKGFKTRIIFERLDRNTYIILQLLVKKSDCDKAYKESVINRYAVYKGVESKIREKIKVPEYINCNNELDNNFQKLLLTKARKKG